MGFFSMLLGLGLGYLIRKQIGAGEINSAEGKAEKILSKQRQRERSDPSGKDKGASHY